MIKSYTDALYSFASSDYENCNIVYSHVLTITSSSSPRKLKNMFMHGLCPLHTLYKNSGKVGAIVIL